MSASPNLIMVQFPEWLATRQCRPEGVLDAWQRALRCGEAGERRVELTERGRAMLGRA